MFVDDVFGHDDRSDYQICDLGVVMYDWCCVMNGCVYSDYFEHVWYFLIDACV